MSLKSVSDGPVHIIGKMMLFSYLVYLMLPVYFNIVDSLAVPLLVGK